MIAFLHPDAVEIPTVPQRRVDLNALKRLMQSDVPPKCLILSPTFSNTMGALMSDSRRAELCRLAEAHHLDPIC